MLEKILLRNKKNSSWLKFSNPQHIFVCSDIAEIRETLRDIEVRVQRDKLYAAGYLTYEAAPAFDPAFKVNSENKLPLLCFGLFGDYEECSNLKNDRDIDLQELDWKLGTSEQTYKKNFTYIKKQIERGNTYQINYTLRNFTENLTDPYQFFLARASNAPYAAYIETKDHTIISASPELFFSLDGDKLESKPMKGTSMRGKTQQEDLDLRIELKQSEKNLAENIMITDMLRNDMGRISLPGSVEVSAICDVEQYPTVWQMTSTVRSKTEVNIEEIIAALFPCASVTGAPKISSMEIISKIEDTPREIYTGAIGFIAPNRQAQFSVPIRTVLLDKKTNEASYGTGGGIVWDSDFLAEFEECMAKAKVLTTTNTNSNFELFETMLWEPRKGIFLRDLHFSRLKNSATYFNFIYNFSRIETELEKYLNKYTSESRKIQIYLNKNGDIKLSSKKMTLINQQKDYTISFAEKAIDLNDVFYYHKTTRRDIYERAKSINRLSNDTLFWNDAGEITESKIANLIINIGNECYTPPVSSGLLGGTYRQMMLDKGLLKERVIHKSEISHLSEITLINSVRGRFRAKLI